MKEKKKKNTKHINTATHEVKENKEAKGVCGTVTRVANSYVCVCLAARAPKKSAVQSAVAAWRQWRDMEHAACAILHQDNFVLHTIRYIPFR